jgi:hypothetical protein
MKVIEHEPQFWFLLQDANSLMLDVNCEHGAVGYDVLIELNVDERSHYENNGRDYLTQLAEAINFSAPGGRGSPSPYKARNIQQQRGEEILAAILAWRDAEARG